MDGAISGDGTANTALSVPLLRSTSAWKFVFLTRIQRPPGSGPAHVERQLVFGWRPCRPQQHALSDRFPARPGEGTSRRRVHSGLRAAEVHCTCGDTIPSRWFAASGALAFFPRHEVNRGSSTDCDASQQLVAMAMYPQLLFRSTKPDHQQIRIRGGDACLDLQVLVRIVFETQWWAVRSGNLYAWPGVVDGSGRSIGNSWSSAQ